jgi:hypothetical protein
MRAEKRVVNAKKELVKLKEVAAKLHGVKDQYGSITKESLESAIPDVVVRDEVPMQVDNQSTSSSKKTKVKIDTRWMNQKKIKAIKSKIKKHNQKKARRGGSARLSSRKAKKGKK